MSLLLHCILYFLDLSIAFCVTPNIFPYRPPSLSFPSSPLFFSYLSIFCKLAALVRHRVSLFGKESVVLCCITLPDAFVCLIFLFFYFSKSYAHTFLSSPSIYILISIICARPLLPLTGPTCVMLLSLQLTLCLALMCSSPWGQMHNTMCAKRQNMYIHDLSTGFPPEPLSLYTTVGDVDIYSD